MTSRRPNIVWITLDSVRADHTSVAGYHRDTTPNLERIAGRPGGTALTNCFAHANWSLPSVASMLTGTYPAYHGTGSHNAVLPSELATVPELLSDAGYATAGVSLNGYVNESTGLDRGFDRFEWLSKWNLLSGAGVGLSLRYLLGLRTHSAGFHPLPTQKHTTDFLARAVAERWLEDLVYERPFFLFVHAQAAHLPYYPPMPYQDRYADELSTSVQDALSVAFEKTDDHLKETAGGCDFTREEWAAIEAMYDAKIAYADAQVGHLFDVLRGLDPGDTVFVVTADHGDLHGEYGILGHLLALHDGLLHVPAIVHGLDVGGPPDRLVQHVDLVQTLVEAAGADAEQLQGVDLREAERRYAISHRGEEDRRRLEKLRAYDPSYAYPRGHSTLLTCARSVQFKYLTSEARTELFELPDEETDVSADHPDVVADFEAAVEGQRAGEGPTLVSSERRETSSAVERQLSDLGYLK